MKTHSYLLGSLVILIALSAIGYAGYLTLREHGATVTEVAAPAPAPSLSPAPAPIALPRLPEPTVVSPLPNEKVKSPLIVTGSVVGNWYFEASFPVVLIDDKGNVLAQSPAQAKSDWMTTSTVPFLATLTFATTTATSGTLILKKDNPSGDPERDQEIGIPVTF